MGALFLVNFQQLTFDLSSVLSPHVSSLTGQQKHSKYTCSMYLLNVNKYNFLRAIKTSIICFYNGQYCLPTTGSDHVNAHTAIFRVVCVHVGTWRRDVVMGVSLAHTQSSHSTLLTVNSLSGIPRRILSPGPEGVLQNQAGSCSRPCSSASSRHLGVSAGRCGQQTRPWPSCWTTTRYKTQLALIYTNQKQNIDPLSDWSEVNLTWISVSPKLVL